LVWSVNKSRPDLFRKLQDLNKVANAETKAHRDFERNVVGSKFGENESSHPDGGCVVAMSLARKLRSALAAETLTDTSDLHARLPFLISYIISKIDKKTVLTSTCIRRRNSE
jgi:hypothetical protein